MADRVHRAWSLLPLGAGLFFAVDGLRPWLLPSGRSWDWTDGLGLAFGALLLFMGMYHLATGKALSRWRA